MERDATPPADAPQAGAQETEVMLRGVPVVITGAGSGLGRAHAVGCAQASALVHVDAGRVCDSCRAQRQVGRVAGPDELDDHATDTEAAAAAELREQVRDDDRLPLPDEPSGSALATQSGGLAGFGLLAADQRGAPIGWWISACSEVAVTVSQMLGHLADLDAVRVLLGFLEALHDVGELADALRAAGPGKPQVVLKGARSGARAPTAQTHTVSIADSGFAFEDVCHRYRVIPARSLEKLLDLALVFHASRGSAATGSGC